MIPRKKRKLMIILSIVFSILVVIGIFVALYLTTDMFKSSKTLFTKYIAQNFDQISKLSDTSYMQEVDTLLEKNKYTSNIEANISYNENSNSNHPINKLNLKVDGQTDKQEKYDYNDITISNENEKLFRIEYIEKDDTHALRLDGIKQFVSNNEDNETIKMLENLKNLNLKELLSFTEEETQNIQNTYLQLINEDVPENNFEKKSGVVITIGDTQVKTNEYSITLTKENFNNLYIRILEQLKQDNIFLQKLDNIENEINKYTSDKKSIKKDFVKNIEETIKNIKDTNIGQEERTISIYESNGKLLKTAIKTETIEASLDIQSKDDYAMIELKLNEDNEKENSIDIKVEKAFNINEESVSIYMKSVKDDISNNIELSTNKKFENNNMNNTLQIETYNENYSGTININKNIKLVNNFDDAIELDNTNNIDFKVLNDEQKEKLDKNLNSQIEKVNSIVSKDDITEILVNLKVVEPIDEIEDTGKVTEAEKNRFNAKYELYESEDIDLASIERLINTAKDDLEAVKITSYEYEEKKNGEKTKVPNGYKLIIKKDNKNEDLANRLLKYLEDSKENSFTVKINSNEDNGLVEEILINVN